MGDSLLQKFDAEVGRRVQEYVDAVGRSLCSLYQEEPWDPGDYRVVLLLREDSE